MARRSHRANDVVSRHLDDYVEQFDSRILEDWMHTIDDGDELVTHLAEAVANSEYARDGADENYGYDGEITRTAERAADDLESRLGDHLDVVVAERCATVALRDGDWTDHYDDDDLEAAAAEAREWLGANVEAAKRADVLDEVTIRCQ